jgi:hypothetical protein
MNAHDVGVEVRRLLRDLPRSWVVVVTTEELAREGVVPEILRVVASTRPRSLLVAAVPDVEIVRAYPALGPTGELASVAAELRGTPPSGARALVVAMGSAVLVAWAWPDASMRLLGLGRT